MFSDLQDVLQCIILQRSKLKAATKYRHTQPLPFSTNAFNMCKLSTSFVSKIPISIVLMNMFLKIQRFFKEPVTFSLEFHVIISLELLFDYFKDILKPISKCW